MLLFGRFFVFCFLCQLLQSEFPSGQSQTSRCVTHIVFYYIRCRCSGVESAIMHDENMKILQQTEHVLAGFHQLCDLVHFSV